MRGNKMAGKIWKIFTRAFQIRPNIYTIPRSLRRCEANARLDFEGSIPQNAIFIAEPFGEMSLLVPELTRRLYVN